MLKEAPGVPRSHPKVSADADDDLKKGGGTRKGEEEEEEEEVKRHLCGGGVVEGESGAAAYDCDNSGSDDFPRLHIVEEERDDDAGAEKLVAAKSEAKDTTGGSPEREEALLQLLERRLPDAAAPQSRSPSVGGCRKRKLYQPVQHDASSRRDDDDDEEEWRRRQADDDEYFRSQLQLMEDHLSLLKKRRSVASDTFKRAGPKKGGGGGGDGCADPAAAIWLHQNGEAAAAAPSSPARDGGGRTMRIFQETERRDSLETAACDLRSLSRYLKTEIAASLTELIDSAVARYFRELGEELPKRRRRRPSSEGDFAPRSEGRPSPSRRCCLAVAARAFDEGAGGFYCDRRRQQQPPLLLPAEDRQATPRGSPQGGGGFAGCCLGSWRSPELSPMSNYDSGSDGQAADPREEALSLVVTPKKRNKVTDMRLTPKSGLPFRMSLAGVEGAALAAHAQTQQQLPAVLDEPINGYPKLGGAARLIRSSPGSPLGGFLHSPPVYGGSPRGNKDFLQAISGDPFCCRNGKRNRLFEDDAVPSIHSSALTPAHLRKAKLMFFWTRYPSSSVLRSFFPDVRFDKNNTAQLIKWFSNFREFFYIQIEKHARQLVGEGVQSPDRIQVAEGSDLFHTLTLHYNKNSCVQPPESFRRVVEQTVKEFFHVIFEKKDREPSWKKSIYKIIARSDESIPDYFQSKSFLDEAE